MAAVNLSGSPLSSVQRAHPHATYGLVVYMFRRACGDMAHVAASAPRPPRCLALASQPTRSRSSCVFTGVHTTRAIYSLISVPILYSKLTELYYCVRTVAEGSAQKVANITEV